MQAITYKFNISYVKIWVTEIIFTVKNYADQEKLCSSKKSCSAEEIMFTLLNHVHQKRSHSSEEITFTRRDHIHQGKLYLLG